MKKRVVLLLVGCVAGFIAVPAAQAADQHGVVAAVAEFIGSGGPRLYVGRDELGECRIFVYPQDDDRQRRLWLEGTFQVATGPVQGIAIPFYVSSSAEESLVEQFEVAPNALTVVVRYPGQQSPQALRLLRKQDGALGAVSYAGSSTARSCANLRRVL